MREYLDVLPSPGGRCLILTIARWAEIETVVRRCNWIAQYSGATPSLVKVTFQTRYGYRKALESARVK